MMNELNTVSALVKEILEEDTQARNDDNVLYLRVLEHSCSRNGICLGTMTVPVFLLHMKDYGLPGFETVRRSRQKVQADNPDLAGSEGVRRKRARKEDEYRAFSRNET